MIFLQKYDIKFYNLTITQIFLSLIPELSIPAMKSLKLSFITLFLLLGASTFLTSQSLNFYLPQEVKTFKQTTTSPKSYFGFEVGEQLLTYDQIVSYFRLLATESNRVKIIENGYTYERKPIVFLVVSSEENIQNLEKIRTEHLQLSIPEESQKLDLNKMPIVNWMGYSIHGNEASGVNASVLVAYSLAASEDSYTKEILKNNVIIIQPAQNPDGVQRYATWVNSNSSYTYNTDENSRIAREPAPSSRSNHYLFDLNRDWLVAQHPESYYRMEIFHQWLPSMLNDFHEQGNNSGTFFSPGRPLSTHPLIPAKNQELTNKISKYHADLLGRDGSLYFTKESYDDFYLGKGGSLPDLFGGIGLLYEQPNARGIATERNGVVVKIQEMIRNQVYCTYSALNASTDLRLEMLSYQRDFFKDNASKVKSDEVKGYIFGDEKDLSLSNELIQILNRQCINAYSLKSDLKIGDKQFKKGSAYVVPFDARNYKILHGLFDKMLNYADSTFYDISTWTVPLGLNIKYSELKEVNSLIGEKVVNTKKGENENTSTLGELRKSNYAYIFELYDYYSYTFLYALMDSGLKVKINDTPFSISSSTGLLSFNRGSVLIPLKEQDITPDKVYEVLIKYKSQFNANTKIYSLSHGLGEDLDLGSPRFKRVLKPSVAILTGRDAQYGSVGELWHLLDQRVKMPVTLIDSESIGAIDLYKYNIIILNGTFRLPKESLEKLSEWARKNTIIATGSAYKTLNDLGIADITSRELARPGVSDSSYQDYLERNSIQALSGAIMEFEMDQTHPLSFGISGSKMSAFVNSQFVLNEPAKKYISFGTFTQKPLLSGYVTDAVNRQIKGTPFVLAGRGVVYFLDDPYFRAYWLGTSRIFLNSIFFRELLPNEKIGMVKK